MHAMFFNSCYDGFLGDFCDILTPAENITGKSSYTYTHGIIISFGNWCLFIYINFDHIVVHAGILYNNDYHCTLNDLPVLSVWDIHLTRIYRYLHLNNKSIKTILLMSYTTCNGSCFHIRRFRPLDIVFRIIFMVLALGDFSCYHWCIIVMDGPFLTICDWLYIAIFETVNMISYYIRQVFSIEIPGILFIK